MKNLFSWKKLGPHLIAVIGLAIISILYASPILSGKKLNQYDDVQARGAAQEAKEYHEKTGEWSSWTNSMFGGMPTFLITGDYPTSVSTKLGQAVNSVLPAPANIFLLSLVSAYILFLVLGASSLLSAFGAIAFTFATFNLVSLEAGHVSKLIAIGYAPGVLAGVVLAFRKNWLSGAALTALFLSLELYGNHIQITYYLGIGVIILVLIESIVLIKAGQAKKLSLILGGLAFAGIIAVGTHTTRLWNAYDYTKETIRGKSELTPAANNQRKPDQDGLDKDYAFNWSYGIGETLTLLIPNSFGGGSQGALDNKSKTYQTLVGRGVDAANAGNFVKALPLYWGDQPSTSGPVYASAIVFFLFVLGLFVVKGRFKFWIGGITLLYIVWAWGKNFEALNYAFFDYFPMFNKFRAVTMTLALAQLMMVVLAVVVLNEIAQKRVSWNSISKPFLISLGLTAGVSLLFALMPTVFFNFRGGSDSMFLDNIAQSSQNRAFAEEIMNAIIQDRAGMLRSDAFRSAFLILLTAGVLWLWIKDKIKPVIASSVLILLLVIDLFGVGKRYLNNDDFVAKQAIQSTLSPSPADELILQDKDPDFRVLDLLRSTFNNAEASYFHKSIGGYHGAKLRRYQELIERQIAKPNPNPDILNMLNTKYILTADQQGNPTAQPNPDAFGHAWFVNNFKIVPNADAEMKALDSLKVKQTAVIDQRFSEDLKGLSPQPDSSNSIQLTSYKPNELTYESTTKGEQLAVFSEIYYNVRDDWKVTIDGNPAKLLRANYVLRALRVPAGKHTIVFKFEPTSVKTGKTIDLIASLLLVGIVIGALVVSAKKES